MDALERWLERNNDPLFLAASRTYVLVYSGLKDDHRGRIVRRIKAVIYFFEVRYLFHGYFFRSLSPIPPLTPNSAAFFSLTSRSTGAGPSGYCVLS